MADSKPKRDRVETVSVKTFKNWDFSRDFHIEVDDGKVTCIHCLICSEHISEIRQEARNRNMGAHIVTGVLAYVDGVRYIHKSNVSRHVQSGSLHDWAKRKFSKPGDAEMPGTTTSTKTSAPSKTTTAPTKTTAPGLESMFEKTSNKLYKNHFYTALTIVMNESSMNQYESLIDMQKKNGVQFVSAKNNDKRCGEFVSYLAKAMKSDISKVMGAANFFSMQQDGTEARKTLEEKEMIYVKVVVRGKPVEIFIKCQRMNEFGGVDADSLKSSVDSAFKEYIPEDGYKYKMVSACADGASVNMGKLSGALTQMKHEREWLLIIHCGAHRIELAVKDAFRQLNHFQKIDDMMLNLHLFFKHSGKCWRILLLVAEKLGVLLLRLPKSAGTRFQAHKYNCIKALIVDFLPLCLFAENMLEASNKTVKPDQKAKLRGYLNQWLDYTYLASMHLYRLTLKETSHLSFIAQNATPLVTDIIHGLESTSVKLEAIQSGTEESDDLPFPCTENDDGSVTLTAEATNLRATTRFKEANKLTDKQRKHAESNITITVQEEFKLKNVTRGKENVKKIKGELIPAIVEAIQTRLDSFNDPIFKAFTIADHKEWDISNPEYGRDELKLITDTFSESLDKHNFSNDMAVREWRELKKLVTAKYRHFKSSVGLWQQIFEYHHAEFPHILLVIELILSVSYSSTTVERGISTLNRQLTSVRTSMSNKTLNELLLLRINLPILVSCDGAYESKLIEKAVHDYTSTPRRQRQPTKRSAVESVHNLHSGSTEDTFLPTPSTSVIKQPENELTQVEDFLQGVIDSDPDSSATEIDSDSDTE